MIENRSGSDTQASSPGWSTDGGSGGAEPDSKPLSAAAAEESKAVAHAAADAGKDVVHEVTAQASVVAGQAREQFGVVLDQARNELKVQVEARTHQAAEGLQTVADQLAALAAGRPQDAGHVGTLVGEAHQRVEAYSRTLAERGPQALIDDVALFARRRPVRFLFSAAVAGFAAGRLARSGVAHDPTPAPVPSVGYGSGPDAAITPATSSYTPGASAFTPGASAFTPGMSGARTPGLR